MNNKSEVNSKFQKQIIFFSRSKGLTIKYFYYIIDVKCFGIFRQYRKLLIDVRKKLLQIKGLRASLSQVA
jgi:hypothetical protein